MKGLNVLFHVIGGLGDGLVQVEDVKDTVAKMLEAELGVEDHWVDCGHVDFCTGATGAIRAAYAAAIDRFKALPPRSLPRC